MRVLIVKMCELSDMSSTMLRTLAVVRGLVQSGVDVELLVLSNNMLQNKYDFLKKTHINVLEVADKKLDESSEKSSRLKVRLINVIRAIYHYCFPFDKTYFKAKGVNRNDIRYDYYDVIISDSDPKTSHIACKKLIDCGLKYDKWVQYWGDPFAADITVKTIFPRSFLKHIEKELFDNSDKIVYTSPFTLEEQKRLFPQFAHKMYYTPTGYLEEKICTPTKGKQVVVTYTGAYYSGVRNIIPLYEACVELESVKCIITGDTDLKLAQTANIEIHSRRSADYELSISDLIVCIMNKEGLQIPGKLYHCAGTNKKILVILDGDNIDATVKFIKQWDRFYCCLNNKTDIKKSILKIARDDREWAPLEAFSAKAVANDIIR